MTTEKFQIPNFALKAIESIAQNEGFTKYSLSASAGARNGDGFFGFILRIKITGESNSTSKDELSIILKLPPTNLIRREQLISKELFEQEIFTYTEMFPKILKFQNNHRIPVEFQFNQYPRCLKVFDDYYNGNYGIIMEDKKMNKFILFDKTKEIDLEHIELVLKTQGKLHGLTFILRKQNPEIFLKLSKMEDKIAKSMIPKEMLDVKDKIFDEALLSLRPNEINAINKLKDMKDNFSEYLEECVNYRNSEPFIVFNHGDSWTNNIMFSYKVCIFCCAVYVQYFT